MNDAPKSLPPGFGFDQARFDAGRAAYAELRESWKSLSLRQDWLDEGFMRAHLSAAGVRVKDSSEPASVSRMRTLLHRAGIDGPEILESIGKRLPGYLELNPNLPLWAAVALVIEATGRFKVEH